MSGTEAKMILGEIIASPEAAKEIWGEIKVKHFVMNVYKLS
jgi:hypothetical protein